MLIYPVIFVIDLFAWLYHAGHDLDPTAALSTSIRPFTPRLPGEGTIGQFSTVPTFGPGFYLTVIAALLVLAGMLLGRSADCSGHRCAGRAGLYVCSGSPSGPRARHCRLPACEVQSLSRAVSQAQPGALIEVGGGEYPAPVIREFMVVGEIIPARALILVVPIQPETEPADSGQSIADPRVRWPS